VLPLAANRNPPGEHRAAGPAPVVL
jgi:hypothetical protein